MNVKPTLTLEFASLADLAKAVVAISASSAAVSVTGGGAAVPGANPSAPAPAAQMAAPAPTSAAPVPTGAPATATASPSNGALTHADVMTAYKAAVPKHGATVISPINQRFGITSPLALKDRPQDWAGYIAALNDPAAFMAQ